MLSFFKSTLLNGCNYCANAMAILMSSTRKNTMALVFPIFGTAFASTYGTKVKSPLKPVATNVVENRFFFDYFYFIHININERFNPLYI